MSWEVEGTDEFASWFRDLDEEQRKAVVAAVDILAEVGPTLSRPLADTLSGSRIANLKELRVMRDAIRILFVFDPRRTAILLLGGSKAGLWTTWYEWAIPEAERLYRDHLETLRKEGSI